MNARINLPIDEAPTLEHDETSALVVALLDSLEGEKQPDIADAGLTKLHNVKKNSWPELQMRLIGKRQKQSY